MEVASQHGVNPTAKWSVQLHVDCLVSYCSWRQICSH